jgi:hypothetical protein
MTSRVKSDAGRSSGARDGQDESSRRRSPERRASGSTGPGRHGGEDVLHLVWLHYAILSSPRRGGRVILLERLRWETLLLWLLHVIEETFGVADATYTERDVEYELALL